VHPHEHTHCIVDPSILKTKRGSIQIDHSNASSEKYHEK